MVIKLIRVTGKSSNLERNDRCSVAFLVRLKALSLISLRYRVLLVHYLDGKFTTKFKKNTISILDHRSLEFIYTSVQVCIRLCLPSCGVMADVRHY